MHYLNQPLDLTFGFTSEETEFLKGYLPKVIQLPSGEVRLNPRFSPSLVMGLPLLKAVTNFLILNLPHTFLPSWPLHGALC